MRISDWSSDVCSSDLPPALRGGAGIAGALAWRPRFPAGGKRYRVDPLSAQRRQPRDDRRPADRADAVRRLSYQHLAGRDHGRTGADRGARSEEHTSELQSLMRISYAVFCLKKKKQHNTIPTLTINTNNQVI